MISYILNQKHKWWKKKFDKWNLIKIKCLGFKWHHQESRKNNQRMRKNFVNHMSNKWLVFNIYKEIINLLTRRQPNFK